MSIKRTTEKLLVCGDIGIDINVDEFLILTFEYEFLDTRQNFSARLQLLHQVIHPR